MEKNFSENYVIADNVIVAYYRDKAIIQNEWGNLFYVEIPKEYVTIGEVMSTEDIIPLNELSEIEQQEILEYLLQEDVI